MFTAILPFIDRYVADLNEFIAKQDGGKKFSKAQRAWLKFCLMGILLTNQVNWSAFERIGMGGYRLAALSWMFRHTQIIWNFLLIASVGMILHQMGIKWGILAADDSDHKRAKRTKRIAFTHKIFDKKTGGYFNGQTLVFLLLVTPKATIPVGFKFYCPDPKQTAWAKEDRKLREKKVKKSERPLQPALDPKYPSKADITLKLIEEFRRFHPKIEIKAVVADALYGTSAFMDSASSNSGHAQVISEIKSNQNVMFRNRKQTVAEYFAAHTGVLQRIRVRGGDEIEVIVNSARLYVCAHEKKRFVIALKYKGEDEYRYLVATDLSWRTLDIVQAYTSRWLIEVFLEDWKLNEGWGQLAKQPDEEGSSRSLILSLLFDHALLLHQEQKARLENKKPACTVGSLCRLSQVEAILEVVRQVLSSDNPADEFAKLAEKVKAMFPLADSGKHMNGRDLGRLEPTPSLRGKAQSACACT